MSTCVVINTTCDSQQKVTTKSRLKNHSQILLEAATNNTQKQSQKQHSLKMAKKKTTQKKAKKKSSSSQPPPRPLSLPQTTEFDNLDIETLQSQIIQSLQNEYSTIFSNRIQIQTQYDTLRTKHYEATNVQLDTMKRNVKAANYELSELTVDFEDEIQVYHDKCDYIQFTHDQQIHVQNDLLQHDIDKEYQNHNQIMQQEEQKEFAFKMAIQERQTVYMQEIQNRRQYITIQLQNIQNQLQQQLQVFLQTTTATNNDNHNHHSENENNNNNKKKKKNEQYQYEKELNNQHFVELRELKELNHLHLYELEKKHTTMYHDTKLYYNRVLMVNQSKMDKLGKDIIQVQNVMHEYKNQCSMLEKENEELSGPLARYRDNVSAKKDNANTRIYMHVIIFLSSNRSIYCCSIIVVVIEQHKYNILRYVFLCFV